MAESTISRKIWSLADVLRDEGVSYGDYLEQITALLFLKMIDEQERLPEPLREIKIKLPEGCGWKYLKGKTGEELTKAWEDMLKDMQETKGYLAKIFKGMKNKIEKPVSLAKVIKMMDFDWSDLSLDVKGEVYESLMERVAQDTKSGAGQYFTPRPLINTIVRCVSPKPGKTVCDPCCGSGGFLLSAKNHISYELGRAATQSQLEFLQNETFYGTELVDATYRTCLMNLALHGIGKLGEDPTITCADSLTQGVSSHMHYVLTNPPFGKKQSQEIEVEKVNKATGETETLLQRQDETISRDDFIAKTKNKQLNFLQHIISLLETGGTAAVVLPDNVLFDTGAGETIRRHLIDTCNLHTILRLPTGIFYKPGVKANVLFFQKCPSSSKQNTKDIWIYDYRTDIHHTLKKNPMKESDLAEFVSLYMPDRLDQRTQTYNAETNPNGRWRRFSVKDEILTRENLDLDIKWIQSEESEAEKMSIEELFAHIEEENRLQSSIIELLSISFNDQTSCLEKIEVTEEQKIFSASSCDRMLIFKHYLRRKILDKAFRGELVPSSETEETGEELLQSLRKAARKINKGKSLKRHVPKDLPFSIPHSWCNVTIADIFNHAAGKALNKSDSKGILKQYITTSNLYWGRFELNNLGEMYYKEDELYRYTATKGDLLLCEGGDVGRAAIWNYDYDICLQNHIHRLRPYLKCINLKFYYYMFFYDFCARKPTPLGVG